MATLALFTGCGTDDPGPLRIEATVRYGGSAQGALTVAAFASIPPMGAPMAFTQEPAPVFPELVTVGDTLEANATVHVMALLDVAPASPQQPGPEDRTVWSSPLALKADGATVIELTLSDP
jgi:hypothetical protein